MACVSVFTVFLFIRRRSLQHQIFQDISKLAQALATESYRKYVYFVKWLYNGGVSRQFMQLLNGMHLIGKIPARFLSKTLDTYTRALSTPSQTIILCFKLPDFKLPTFKASDNNSSSYILGFVSRKQFYNSTGARTSGGIRANQKAGRKHTNCIKLQNT